MNIGKPALILSLILFFAASITSAEDARRSEEKSHIGKVTYTQKAGKYTYIKLNEEGHEVWLASFPVEVSEGDKVEYMGGVLMKNFYSKAMSKTFDSILFVTRVRVLNEDILIDKKPMPSDEYHKIMQKNKQAVSIPKSKSGEIVKAEGGKTIEEIFSEKGQLNNKEVIIHAKVIKVSENILGKNWITLRDGSGVPPDDKIIAITSEDVNVGDILIVKGIVKTEINIGAGYNYKVLLENAKFTK